VISQAISDGIDFAVQFVWMMIRIYWRLFSGIYKAQKQRQAQDPWNGDGKEVSKWQKSTSLSVSSAASSTGSVVSSDRLAEIRSRRSQARELFTK
jgi:hypothetical protein